MWNLHPSERLRYWQDFRHKISDMDLDKAIYETTHLWSYAPFVKYYLTTDQIKNWPSPWELIYDNYYCDLAKALGILYTLGLSKHKPSMEICIYNDKTDNQLYNLVFVDQGKYVLNYTHDEVVNKKQINKNLILQKIISDREFELDKF